MGRVTTAALRALTGKLAGKRVLVAGDLILDAYVWGAVQRISQEAPVPVVAVQGESLALGGAANVAENIRALGGVPLLIGVTGTDPAGEELRGLLTDRGLSPAGLLTDPARPTTRKLRIIAQSQQVVRVDREVTAPLDAALRAKFAATVQRELAQAQALVLSDYGKGVFSRELIRTLIGLARRRGITVLVDPKIEHFAQYGGAGVMTPNVHELSGGVGQALRTYDAQLAAGERVLRRLKLEALLVTRGPDGMLLLERGRRPLAVPTVARKVFDVTGAGDTVISVLALALAAGASYAAGAMLANHAAGIVVGKLGAATVTPVELRSVL